jgi:hypothetical protein
MIRRSSTGAALLARDGPHLDELAGDSIAGISLDLLRVLPASKFYW